MDERLFVLMLSLLSGVLGTGIGGVVGACVKDKSPSAMGGMLAFAGGIMLGVVALEMLPEAVLASAISDKKFFGALIALCAVCAGVGCAFCINFIVEKIEIKRKYVGLESQKNDVYTTKAQSVEILKAKSKSGLKKAGIVTFLAIAFHNIPEGMAIGASGANNIAAGMLVALIIAIHNVPEGMAISAPLVGGGVKQMRAVILAILAGLSTLLGGIVGLLVGGVSALANGICMALASGAMTYVSCFDLLPIATRLKGEFPRGAFFFGLTVATIFSLLF